MARQAPAGTDAEESYGGVQEDGGPVLCEETTKVLHSSNKTKAAKGYDYSL